MFSFFAMLLLVFLVILLLGLKRYLMKLAAGICLDADISAPQIVPALARGCYPYQIVLSVPDLSSLSACQIELALSRLDGVWAVANPDKKTVLVHMRKKLGADILCSTIADTGLTVTCTDGSSK